MPTETELKFMPAALEDLHGRLLEQGAVWLERHFERNLVFDTPGRELRGQDVLLRLRSAGATYLTLKKPPAHGGETQFKVWDERETRVEDFEAMRAILEGLGYEAAFAYEKLREEWRLQGCIVCLDRLPFGDCLELEGEPQQIRRCAEALGLDPECGLKKSYHQLHREHREARGLAPQDSFVFPQGAPPGEFPWPVPPDARGRG